MKRPWYMRRKPAVLFVAGLGGLFTVIHLPGAQPWAATTTPGLQWSALAASADGTKLVAAATACIGYCDGSPAPIYASTDAGASWILTGAPSNCWASVACSADGVKLVAVASSLGTPPTSISVGDGLIYTSSDMGATWTPTSAPSNTWSAVASSADGNRLVAVSREGGDGGYYCVGKGAIYRSQDAGVNWTVTTAPSNNWTCIASSADGIKLVAASQPLQFWDESGSRHVGEGAIFRSLDAGATWSRTSAPSNTWTSVASSANGAELVAVAELISEGSAHADGLIYTSSDSGATWNPTRAPSNNWYCVASSADGTKLVAGPGSHGYYYGDGKIYTSSDSGRTWTATGSPRGGWMALATSADGYRVLAGSWWVPLCILPYSGPWRGADVPDNDWESVASSADGGKLAAVGSSDGAIYTSRDWGTTWGPTTAPSNRWSAVASSADGTKLVAVATTDPKNGDDGLIYTSSNAGAVWMPTSAPSNNWSSVASSADGAKLVAVSAPRWSGSVQSYVGEGRIYSSLDSGATWSQTTAPSNNWSSVASSADGGKLVAVATTYQNNGGDGLIYTSSNAGAVWTPTSAPSNNWSSVASSADGTKLVAGAYGDTSGLIYTSSDSGATWTHTSAPRENWWSVTSSADGTKLVALGGGWSSRWCSIYISTNSGASWTPALDAPVAPSWWAWSAVAASSEGNNIVAVGSGLICTLRSPVPPPPLPPSPRLAIDWSGANMGLSWLVPSTRFGLQQSSDLCSANWVDVPTSPTLDCTNLHHRVTLMPGTGSSFYRLKQQ